MTPTTPATSTTATTVTSGLFTFQFAAGMQLSDQTLMQSAVTSASSFYLSSMGRTITQPTTISASTTDPGCANPGSSAFTGQRLVTICVGNSGWTVHNALNKQKILTHELFHAVQFEMRWLGGPGGAGSGAQWMIEGSAEYVGWRGVASAGLVAFDTTRGCMVQQASALGAGPTLSLDTMETPAGFGVPWAYQFGMLGVDETIGSGNMSSLITYGNALAGGASFASAFQSSFGLTTTSLYSQFPSYRASLASLSSTACGT
jgi:hypothetical protein